MFRWTSAARNIQGGPKINTISLYALTSSNINRFSKLFHCQNQEKICNNGVAIKIPPRTPQCVANLVYYNRSWKGRGQGHLTEVKILHPIKYLQNGYKLQISNFVHGLATKSTKSFRWPTACPLSGRGQGDVTHSRISHPLKYLERLQLESSNFTCPCRLWTTGCPWIKGAWPGLRDGFQQFCNPVLEFLWNGWR